MSNHIDLQGLRLPPLDKGKLWIHAAGCTDAAQPPAPCEQRKSGYSIHAVSPSCTFCGEENKYEIDPESACAACLPLYRDTYTTSPFFVRCAPLPPPPPCSSVQPTPAAADVTDSV